MLEATEEQKEFIKELLADRPCFLSARAGTGKTSTIRLGIEALKEKGYPLQNITVVAFNKANQEDLSRVLPQECKVATLHSLGFQSLRRFLPGLKLETDKLFKLVSEAGIRGKNSRDIFKDTMKLVSAAKSQGLVVKPLKKGNLFREGILENTGKNWLDLVERYELWDADIEKGREILQKSNELSLEERIIDFDDMVYLPVALGQKIITSDKLIVDEAQDLSPLNLKMLKEIPSKIWYVGDPYQTIYAWRGAETKAIESLGLRTLPLTNCWRCSGEIIKEARKLVPDIRTTNPDGVPVRTLEETPDWEELSPATILARRNSQLILIALKLRASKSKTQVCIFGRDFAKTLEGILEKLKGTTSKALKESLRVWTTKMIQKYPHQEGELKDYQVSLESILSEVSGVQAAKKLLEEIFTDSPKEGCWILSTIHKAKGKEWKKVYLLDWEKKGEQGWQKIEERNLEYVGITRAREELIRVKEEKKVLLDETLRSTGQIVFSRGEEVYRGEGEDDPQAELLSGGESYGGLWD